MTAAFRRGPAGLYLRDEPLTRGGTAAFLPASATLPEVAGQAELLRHPGVFLYLRSLPADPEAFAAKAKRLLARGGRPQLAFAWIHDPEGEPPAWSRRPVLRLWSGPNTTTCLWCLALNNYTLFMGAGCLMSGDGPTCTPYGLGKIYLASNYGAETFPIGSLVLPGESSDITFNVQTDTVAGLAALGVGLRYAVNDPEYPGWGRLRTLEFPLGSGEPVGITLTVAVTSDEQWAIGLAGPISLESTFTGFGGPATLLQVAGGQFVSATCPPGTTPGPYDPVDFCPEGPFGVLGVERLLGGLSGAEYFTGPTQISFTSGQPACAPSVGAAATPGAAGLTGPTTTAYATVVAAGYASQPMANAFHQPPGDFGTLAYPVLEYLELTGTPQGTTPFPMAPFGGVSPGDARLAQMLEQQVLSAARLAAVNPLPGAPAQPVTAALPSGLLATWTTQGDPSYDLYFGQNGGAQLVFSGVQGDLLNALQASQLFLVVSDIGELGGCLSSGLPPPLTVDTASFGDWTFDLFGTQTSQWSPGPQQTVMVFKFAAGALGDLVADLNAWTAPGTFAPDVAGSPSAQAVLQASIAQARQAYAAGSTEFAFFVETVVQDPDWRGLIFFNVAIPATTLPQPLEAGTGGAPLLAHHFGFSVSPIQASGGALSFGGDSTLFGAVAYAAAGDLTFGSVPYAFQVQTLDLLFQSSTLMSASVQVELMVCELFGEQVTLRDGPHGNNLLLGGSYQAGGGFAFSLVSGAPSVFTVSSAVLDTVTVTAAQLAQTPDGDWQFTLSGTLAFQTFGAWDLFSFGALAFSGTTLTMSVDGTQYTFSGFDASQAALNLNASVPRAGSLFRSLPIVPTGFLQVLTPGTTPATLGYLGVAAAVSQGTLSAPWYGLLCTLNLGSAGSLAPAGGFTAQFLAAWSPSPWSPGSSAVPAPNVAVGMIFPGTSTGSPDTSTLQGVLKLQLGDVALAMGPDGGYVLTMTGMALKLFGISLPPGGQADAYFFGAPASAGSPSIGWYLGYPASGQEG